MGFVRKILFSCIAALVFVNLSAQESGSILFDVTEKSFGEIADSAGIVAVDFRFVNTGANKFIVKGLTTSCGCLKAVSDAAVYDAGGEGVVTLMFNPHRTAGDIFVRAFLYTDFSHDKPAAELALTGKVAVSDEWDYLPVAAGDLRLKTDCARLPKDEKTVRVLCANTGSKSLSPQVTMVPQGMKAWFEPEVIPPGSEADLVISVSARIPQAALMIKPDSGAPLIMKLICE